MIGVEHQQLEDVERRVCDIAAVQLGIARARHLPGPTDRRGPELRQP